MGKNEVTTKIRQRIYNWILRLIKFLDNLPKDFVSQTIVKQLLRSGTSIGANYIEAQAGSSKKDFTNFIQHSLKSANESKFWLAILRDARGKNVQELLSELTEISNILGATVITLKGKRKI